MLHWNNRSHTSKIWRSAVTTHVPAQFHPLQLLLWTQKKNSSSKQESTRSSKPRMNKSLLSKPKSSSLANSWQRRKPMLKHKRQELTSLLLKILSWSKRKKSLLFFTRSMLLWRKLLLPKRNLEKCKEHRLLRPKSVRFQDKCIMKNKSFRRPKRKLQLIKRRLLKTLQLLQKLLKELPNWKKSQILKKRCALKVWHNTAALFDQLF